MAEVKHQIWILKTIHDAVGQLMPLVPSSAHMTDENAQKAEGLVRALCIKIPRVAATMLPMVGVRATVAAIAGGALFGGKKMLEAVKSAKDILGGGS